MLDIGNLLLADLALMLKVEAHLALLRDRVAAATAKGHGRETEKRRPQSRPTGRLQQGTDIMDEDATANYLVWSLGTLMIFVLLRFPHVGQSTQSGPKPSSFGNRTGAALPTSSTSSSSIGAVCF